MSDGPSVYLDDNGVWCYRLSAWGGCIRELVAARKGITPMPSSGEPDPWLREGHLHEGDVIEQLVADGWSVEDRQEEVVLDVPPGRIVGHLDGGKVERDSHGPALLEVKALGKATFSDCESLGVEQWMSHHQTYSWQVAGAMHAKGTPAVVIVKSRDSGKVLIGEITVPPKSMIDFEDRMRLIEEWVKVDRFPPCEKTGFCWKGPYRHIHYKDGAPRDPIPIHETRNQAIEDLVEKLADARKERKAITEKEEELKDELLGMAGIGVYLTDHHKVTIREVESVRMDTKAVRADHGSKYDREVKYPNIRIDPR